MRKEIAHKWADLLESGEIKKTTGYLERFDGSCCALGVLCNIAAVEGVVEVEKCADRQEVLFGCEGETAELPVEVRDWAGMKTQNGTIPGEGRSIIHLNDSAGLSFKAIAERIRNNYEEM